MASSHSRISIEALAPHHDRADFSCGAEALDRYIRQQASQDARKNVAATFVLIETGNPAVLGFYTLSATSVQLKDLPEVTAKQLPKYPQVPAILMGRLAVDQSQKGKGVGKLLLIDAMKRCLDTKDIAWMALIVDAKDDEAIVFYEHYQFIRFSPTSNKLFLPRKTMSSLLEK